MTKPTKQLETLDVNQLARTTGGNSPVVTDPVVCTPDNPSGGRIYHQSAHSYPRR